MKRMITLVIVVLLISACAPINATDEMILEKTDEKNIAQTIEPAIEITAEEMTAEAAESPTFFDASLTNVATGESFKISDFAGKVVLVENLAMWCPTCLKQQEQVKLLHNQLVKDSGLIS
ncbi:MAG: peroxiredoxin family protein, partial [Anaerolineaceae bacterium]